jgi:hypothetical protein
MEFKEKTKKICQVKYAILCCLILLFLWWGSNALFRYWSQPLSTDISYKYGETDQGIQFPLITLCNWNIFVNDPMIKECHDGSWNFISTLISCIKRNKTSHMQNFHPEIRYIVEMVRIWTGSGYTNLEHGTVWTKVFHQKGPCFAFDISKVDKFKYVSLKPGERPGIEFIIAKNNPWKDLGLILHTKFDLPDGFGLNGFQQMSLFLDKIHKVHKVEFRKKISKKESTRKGPCVKHEYLTCLSIEDNRVIFERFHCSVPILYSGPHLDNSTGKEATNCDYDVTLEALDFISSKESNCSASQTCDNVRFTTKLKVQETWVENKDLIFVVLENPEVQYHNSYISYDLISLIGEVGGILGITLGASAWTLFECLIKCFKRYKERPRTNDVSPS